MPTKRTRRTRGRVQLPDTLERYWAGDLPPDRAATNDEREMIIEAKFFAWADSAKPATVTWTHHPHAAAWTGWLRGSAGATQGAG